MRQFVLSFAELVSDRLSRQLIMQAMQTPSGTGREGSDAGL